MVRRADGIPASLAGNLLENARRKVRCVVGNGQSEGILCPVRHLHEEQSTAASAFPQSRQASNRVLDVLEHVDHRNDIVLPHQIFKPRSLKMFPFWKALQITEVAVIELGSTQRPSRELSAKLP